MDDAHRTGLRHRLADRVDKLEDGKHTGFVVAVTKRFFAIDGIDQGGLLAIEYFTTVIPLVLIGYSFLKRFSKTVSVGEIFIKQLGVKPPLDQTVRSAFGSSAALHSVWTFAGLASFLVWGIPMSITVSGVFAKAWRREPFPIVHRLWRGTLWFMLSLATMSIAQRVAGLTPQQVPRVVVVVGSLSAAFLFWAMSPVLLVQERIRGWRPLVAAGLTGAVIDVLVLRLAVRLIFPKILSGWQGFGPIGVAMTLMTWSGVIGIVWVVSACAGAVMWERSAAGRAALEAGAGGS